MTAARKVQDNSAIPAKYRVVTTLGSGGTALVYLAVAERTAGFQKLVVLKTLLGHLANDPSVADMFRNEARIAARLKHPNVVEVYEVFDDLDQPVLVMEYLRGASLRDLVRKTADRDAIPLRHHIDIIRQSCRGLHHCHELRDFDGTLMHFIHRDVSPHNIYVTFEGEVRLLDFGIAKVQGHDGGTQTGLLKGKIRYMAPEQMMGEELDRRADIYAIGVVLWEAIAGREMWGNVTEGMILHRTVNGDLPELEPPEDCPPEFIEIVKRCLAVRREERYETAEQVADALDQAIRKLPEPARRLGQFVQAQFSARDDEVNLLVRSALAKSEGVPTFPGGVVDWGDVLTDTRTGPHAFDSRSVFSRTTRHPSAFADQAPARPSRWKWAALVGLAVTVMGGGAFAYGRQGPPPSALQTPPVQNLRLNPEVGLEAQRTLAVLRAEKPEVPIVEVQPVDVKIRVQTSPRAASLYLDGELIGNPSIVTREPGSKHTLRATARGYDDAEQELVFETDQEVELKLSRRSTSRHSASASTAQTSAPAEATPPPEPEAAKDSVKPRGILTKDDCKPQYQVRENGLLSVKKPQSEACRTLK